MRILTAMTEMRAVLVAVQAPQRQLDGVDAWRGDIAAAVAAARPFPTRAGMTIDDAARVTARGTRHPEQVMFLYGTRTHRAWLNLCAALINALVSQEREADNLRRAALASAHAASRRGRTGEAAMAAALRAAREAEHWQLQARMAADAGRDLVSRENKIMRPVGLAIAAAGGVAQVALDKHYHQADYHRAGRIR